MKTTHSESSSGHAGVGALILATVHGPLTAADAESRLPSLGGATPRPPRGLPDGKASVSGRQPVSHERADAKAAVSQAPGLEAEAILAADAILEDRAYGQK